MNGTSRSSSSQELRNSKHLTLDAPERSLKGQQSSIKSNLANAVKSSNGSTTASTINVLFRRPDARNHNVDRDTDSQASLSNFVPQTSRTQPEIGVPFKRSKVKFSEACKLFIIYYFVVVQSE